jgi:type VI secretion system protein ImpM
MSSEIIKTGYFGKVPTHGDFVSHGLPTSFIQPWDAWLQQAILSSRQQLGDKEWLNYYLTSPIYRFVLSPAICGNESWSGVIMPSVDQVGRYYPMTLSSKNTADTNPFLTLQQNQDWFSNLETLALTCLQDDFNLKQFNMNLNDVLSVPTNDCPVKDPIPGQSDFETAPHTYYHPLNSLDLMGELLPNFVDQLLKQHCFAYSVWWTQGSEHVPPTLLVCEGLPPFGGIAAMFDGNWSKWGWGNNNNYSFPYNQPESK